jgi:hAT family C-terminal dimerisation region
METTLRFYYEKTKFPTVYGDAMILNPRVKLTLFEEETWDDTDASHYTIGCCRRFLDVYANRPSNSASDSATPRPTAGNRSAQAAFHDDVEYQELLAQRSFKRRRNDFDRYIEIPSDTNIPSSLKWWRGNHKLFPDLAKMARDVLAVPASGCAVVREFSISRRIATWQSNCLNGNTIADAMFYKSALKRRGAALRNSKVDDDHDLPIPERIGVIPQEWRDKWWMEKTKHAVGPEILAMFSQN